MLTPAQARCAGGTYTDGEFDLAPLDGLRPHMVELGRSCVRVGYRSGSVILALWGALAAFMLDNRLDTMIGCASIPMGGGPGCAAAPDFWPAGIWKNLQRTCLADPPYRVRPLLPLPLGNIAQVQDREAPALIKGYLRLGARVLGPPAWDPDFNTADLPMLMQVADLPPRFRQGGG